MRGERLKDKVIIWKARCLSGQLFNKGALDTGWILENQASTTEHATFGLSQRLELLFLVSRDLLSPLESNF